MPIGSPEISEIVLGDKIKSLMGLLMEIWEICHQDLIDGYVPLLVSVARAAVELKLTLFNSM